MRSNALPAPVASEHAVSTLTPRHLREYGSLCSDSQVKLINRLGLHEEAHIKHTYSIYIVISLRVYIRRVL